MPIDERTLGQLQVTIRADTRRFAAGLVRVSIAIQELGAQMRALGVQAGKAWTAFRRLLTPPPHVHIAWLPWLGFRSEPWTGDWVSPWLGRITQDDLIWRWR